METKHKEFKAFDKVIYRLKYSAPTSWHCGLFSDYNKQNNHITLCDNFAFLLDKYDILPYEGNEHLVGTTDESDEEVKLEEGELLIYFEDIQDLENMNLLLARFDGISNDLIKVKTADRLNKWEFAIRFSDFNPNDMEETKKHILCVKNGKVIRYKG